MAIPGDIVPGSNYAVGKVAAPAAGNQDFLSDPSGMVEHEDRPAASGGLPSAHKTGGSGADDDDIPVHHNR